MSMERKNWLRVATQLKGSVIPTVYKRVLGCGLFGVLISCLHFYKIPVSYPILSTIVPSIVLGLLLVFRSNTAYDRFWEGRRLWGAINNSVRNLSRQMWVNIATITPEDRAKKVIFIY